MTAALANLWPHILAVAALTVLGFRMESLWQQANATLDVLLADTDTDLDAAMAAACKDEADREWLAMYATAEFDRLSIEFMDAALGDDEWRWA